MKHIAIMAGAVLLATPAPAADDLLLAKLAGDWVGRGVYIQKPGAEPERVYCKVTGKLTNGGGALVQKGRCAVADNTARMELEIVAQGSGVYTGSGGGVGVASRGQATFTATGSADDMDIEAQLINTQSHETSEATITVEVSADGSYLVRAQMADKETGATFTVSEIVFAVK